MFPHNSDFDRRDENSSSNDSHVHGKEKVVFVAENSQLLVLLDYTFFNNMD